MVSKINPIEYKNTIELIYLIYEVVPVMTFTSLFYDVIKPTFSLQP